jgi:hypothetical protein
VSFQAPEEALHHGKSDGPGRWTFAQRVIANGGAKFGARLEPAMVIGA